MNGIVIKSMFNWLKTIFSAFLITLIITLHLSFTSPTPAYASTPFDFVSPKQLVKLLSNKLLVKDAKRFLEATPETICTAYFNKSAGIDSSTWKTIEEGATSAFTITHAIVSASTAGAGSLSGYAGIASAVSQLGLGSLTTAIAGMMGSSVTGAAATAVVTSAVGGPLVMSALLVGGTSATAFGTYELGKLAVERLGNWVESYCTSSSTSKSYEDVAITPH
ncbi:hypothetical protein BZZ01_19325 [Nostocales cyanobacterium HT-58-2]|nr:hypothetical protein BZZ01_19325 [Nostocales cyanobacterium HT-58-2]